MMVKNMKKNLVSILSAVFTIGTTFVFITVKLADKEQLFYIGTVAAIVVSALAIFFIVKRIYVDFHEKLEQNDKLIGSIIKKNEDLEKSLAEYVNMQDNMNVLFSDFCSKNDSAMEKLENTQNAFAAENTEHINKLSNHIENMINKLIYEYAIENEKQCLKNAEHISKINELTASFIQDNQKQYSKLTSAITTILSETRNAISDGNNIAKKHYEDQDECLENRINDLERIFKNKLTEYNDKLDETLKIIVDLEKMIELNTESYHNTLKQITDNQNAMNSLTSKDIAVLERLVNK